MRTFATMTRVELALQLREPAAVFFTLLLPLILLVLNGSAALAEGEPPLVDGRPFLSVLVPGFVVFVLATTAVMGLPETLARYRERGFLRRMRVSPLRTWQILGAHAVTHLVLTLVGLVVLVVVAATAYGLQAPESVGAVAVATLLSTAAVVSIGFVLAALLPSTRMVQAVAAALYFPSIFISGAVMPGGTLPAAAEEVANVLPFTYAVTAMVDAWTIGEPHWAAYGVLVGTAVVGTSVALSAFRWETRY